MTTLPGPIKAILAAALVLFVGAGLLQSFSPAGRSDPIASTLNGGPRGLLLLALALDREGRTLTRVDSDAAFAAAVGDDTGNDAVDVIVIVPPPEETTFSADEAKRLLAVADRGARVVVVCDPLKERRKRLRPLLDALGLRCEGQADAKPQRVTIAAPPLSIFVRDGGVVVVAEDTPGVLPLNETSDGQGVVGAVVMHGQGDVVVIGSASTIANDGLVEADNARWLADLVGGRRTIVVDERHHVTRGRAVVARALLQGPGPLTALLCALLLVPLTMLSLSPRRGALFATSQAPDVPASGARVRGLATLLAVARAKPRGPAGSTTTTPMTAPPTTAPPPSQTDRPGVAP